jgi:hypothetical protein
VSLNCSYTRLCSVSLQTGRQGFDPRQRQWIFFFSTLYVQTSSLCPHSLLPIGYGGPFPGVERGCGVTLTTHPHLKRRSRMCGSYTSFPPWRLHGGSVQGSIVCWVFPWRSDLPVSFQGKDTSWHLACVLISPTRFLFIVLCCQSSTSRPLLGNYVSVNMLMGRDSSVSMDLLRSGQPSSIPGRGNTSRPALGLTQPLTQWVPGTLSY